MYLGPIFKHHDAWTQNFFDVPKKEERKQAVKKAHISAPCQTLMLSGLPNKERMRKLLAHTVMGDAVPMPIRIGHSMANPVDVMSKKDGRRISALNASMQEYRVVWWERLKDSSNIQIIIGSKFRVWLNYADKNTFPSIINFDVVPVGSTISNYLE